MSNNLLESFYGMSPDKQGSAALTAANGCLPLSAAATHDSSQTKTKTKTEKRLGQSELSPLLEDQENNQSLVGVEDMSPAQQRAVHAADVREKIALFLMNNLPLLLAALVPQFSRMIVYTGVTAVFLCLVFPAIIALDITALPKWHPPATVAATAASGGAQADGMPIDVWLMSGALGNKWVIWSLLLVRLL